MYWISSSLVPYVRDISILPYFRSDHSYVYLSFSLSDAPERGKGCWKLNNTLLKNDTYVNVIKTFWNDCKKEQVHYPSLPVWWDVGKQLIRQITIDFASDLADSQRKLYNDLSNKLSILTSRRNAMKLLWRNALPLCILSLPINLRGWKALLMNFIVHSGNVWVQI